MKYVLTGARMQAADAYTIEQKKVPSLILMEHAAQQITDILTEERFDKKKVLIVCGSGNNGGDGMAVARMLFLMGINVAVYMAGNMEHASEQAKIQMDILKAYNVPFTEDLDFAGYTLIVDAIFGVGLSRDVKGSYADVIAAINSSGAAVVAVDIPSGIHADNGHILGCAVKADETVTMAYAKAGHYYSPGCEYTGTLHVADIGIYLDGSDDGKPIRKIMEEDDLTALRVRHDRSNKGDYGKVLVIAGSKGIAGAAFFAAAGAYRSGCGLVKIMTVEENRQILQTKIPEAMMSILSMENPDYEKISKDLAWADSIVIGPGFGTGYESAKILSFVLDNAKVPCVLDADAITLMASCKIRIPDGLTAVITPHPGELSRLLGMSVGEILADTENAALKAAATYHCICILKDHHTLTVSPDGEIYINTTGNSGMSTGGSGDVLSGICGALLALGGDPLTSAAGAVYLHGHAGDLAAGRKGPHAMLASDILDSL